MGLKAMQERGRLQEGMVADITLFDRESVTDNSTFAKGTLPSTGIPHVIVNGIIVMRDSEPIKRFDAGQPIRCEVQEKGRLVPLTVAGWTREFYASPVNLAAAFPVR